MGAHVRVMIVGWCAIFHWTSGFHNSVAAKITHTHTFWPHRAPPACFGSMVFTMKKNPYLQAGEKQGEKRNGTYGDNGNIQKKIRKAPSAASLVP